MMRTSCNSNRPDGHNDNTILAPSYALLQNTFVEEVFYEIINVTIKNLAVDAPVVLSNNNLDL